MGNVLEIALLSSFFVLCLCGLLGFALLKQPVHAALSFALCVLSGAGFYLILAAPYIAAATVIVYAGATIIIFLFALMFAQQSVLESYDLKLNNGVLSSLACLSLLGILCWSIFAFGSVADGSISASAETKVLPQDSSSDSSIEAAPAIPLLTNETVSVSSLGSLMYTRYLWAIELAGTLLLVAAIGAICISRGNSSDTQTALGTRS